MSTLCLHCPFPQLVFSESWWVGTKEENPSEERLPLPPELQMEQVHTNYEFDSGAGGTGMPVGKLPLCLTGGRRTKERAGGGRGEESR